jgi:hypothetical protein
VHNNFPFQAIPSAKIVKHSSTPGKEFLHFTGIDEKLDSLVSLRDVFSLNNGSKIILQPVPVVIYMPDSNPVREGSQRPWAWSVPASNP